MSSTNRAPWVKLTHLDQLWFQIAGTVCNLTCNHCFISCSPKNHAFEFLTIQHVRKHLRESVALGVKEYFYTGGEPFLHRDMVRILVETLDFGPATVLTNGTVLKDEWLRELADADARSPYSLEFRVSIDGFSTETNDPIRGAGTFERAIHGVMKLVQFDFMPLITAARTWPYGDEEYVVGQFVRTLKQAGYARPRLKILPTLHLGAEVDRTHGYSKLDRVDEMMMDGFDQSQLICEHSRIVTDRGVHVCPILIESPDSVMGQSLAEANRPYQLNHGACFTCYQFGAICSNPSGGLGTLPVSRSGEETLGET